MFFLESIWLIPMFPLLGAALMLLAGRRLDPQHPLGPPEDEAHAGHADASPGRRIINILCPGMVLLSFLFSVGAIFQLQGVDGHSYEVVKWTWLAGLDSGTDAGVRAFTADWGFLLDSLSAVMVLVITGVGFLIHVYSTGYMAHDGGYYRFFGFLNLFLFFMLVLVLGNNYALLFVGWEGVGFCSFGLIGFYFRKKSASDAANKAFIVNRVGDAGFILAMLLTFTTLGTLQFTEVGPALEAGGFQAEQAWGPLTLMGLLFFVGAAGKSAQLPLHVWLPDAMEGPTPVSALIHAATMVTAGVYLVARSSQIFVLAPNAMLVVAVVGGLTAIFAASIGLVQYDIKKVLAYSTVSQLGYMFLACGVGAFWVGIFHLYTHAFFKALLFLGSGSVIHAVGGEQDMRRMGALKDKIPVTFKTMLVGALAIAGIPGLAGFFSKDEILWKAYSSHHTLLYALGLVTAMMTAFYMFRLIYMTFYGDDRVAPGTHVHESPRSMTVPLIALAAGSVLAGLDRHAAGLRPGPRRAAQPRALAREFRGGRLGARRGRRAPQRAAGVGPHGPLCGPGPGGDRAGGAHVPHRPVRGRADARARRARAAPAPAEQVQRRRDLQRALRPGRGEGWRPPACSVRHPGDRRRGERNRPPDLHHVPAHSVLRQVVRGRHRQRDRIRREARLLPRADVPDGPGSELRAAVPDRSRDRRGVLLIQIRESGRQRPDRTTP